MATSRTEEWLPGNAREGASCISLAAGKASIAFDTRATCISSPAEKSRAAAWRIPRASSLLVAASLAFLLLALSGCAGNKYVPCCAKSGALDELGNPLPVLQCQFSDGRIYGGCIFANQDPSTSISERIKEGLRCVQGATTLCDGLNGQAACERNPGCQWNGGACSAKPFCDGLDGTTCGKSVGCRWSGSACIQQQCGNIEDQDSCKQMGCTWGGTPSSCQGGLVVPIFPICVDDAPQNCVDNRCTAMMCGIAGLHPAPPPTSQDWNNAAQGNPSDAAPVSEMASTPQINLQGTSCSFLTMTKKLYNKVQNSQGSYWVNSFRFGVGKSFSDYESSRNFFPSSDRFCTPSPTGTKDRFVNYLRLESQYCAEFTGTYYRCSITGFNYTSQSACTGFCNGDSSRCVALTSPKQYQCPETGWAYGTKNLCEQKCGVVQSPDSCTNDQTIYPYLSDGGRYQMRYLGDYVTSTNNWGGEGSEDPTCALHVTYFSGSDFGGPYGWYPDYHMICNDYYTGGRAGGDAFGATPVDGPWWWANASATTDRTNSGAGANGQRGGLTDYFESNPGSYKTVDLDTQYYKDKLFQQYAVNESGQPDPDKQLAFECASSSECMSGSCDKDTYSRDLIEIDDPAQPTKNLVDAKCNYNRIGADPTLDCSRAYPSPVYMQVEGNGISTASLHEVGPPTTGLFSSWSKLQGQNGKNNYTIYVPRIVGQTHELFSKCQVPKTRSSVPMCLYTLFRWDGDIHHLPDKFTTALIETGGACGPLVVGGWRTYPDQNGAPVTIDVYNVDFSNLPVAGKWGVCKLQSPTDRPYLAMQKMGWCAACTASTLAVQNVTWAAHPYSCYEYEADSYYSVLAGTRTDAGGNPAYTVRSAGVDLVRKSQGGSKLDGNIERDIFNSPFIGSDSAQYGCHDEWNGIATAQIPIIGDKKITIMTSGGWWGYQEMMPTPSAPYLQKKLPAYLEANVMPILDVRDSVPQSTVLTKNLGPQCMFAFSVPLLGMSFYSCNAYDPESICRDYRGDGSVLYAVSDTSLLAQPGHNQGSMLHIAGYNDGIFEYLDSAHTGHADGSGNLDGAGSLMARAQMLKDDCKDAPLVGLALQPTDTLQTLIGPPACDTSGEPAGCCDYTDSAAACRGLLHKFFYTNYDPNYPGGAVQFANRVKNAIVDTYPGKVDLFLQEWTPTCTGTPFSPQSINATEYEFESRMNFSRALLGNFSKPSLIWKFHFPAGSQCDQAVFLEYLFNNTGTMVDSGITGIVYDSWMTQSGKGYGNPALGYGTSAASGLDNVIAQGALDSGPAGPTLSKTNTPFCALQKNSIKLLGITHISYGEKLVALDRACSCTECTANDYALGLCNKNAADDPNLPQLFCNDGQTCTMPKDASGAPLSNTHNYRCPSTCISLDACNANLCSASGGSSFCIINQAGLGTVAQTKPLASIVDDYWEFVAGLPAQDKCCLVTPTSPTQPEQEYTYVLAQGGKQQAQFLQFPRQGETGIDCGNVPDTSVLKYCNVRIPISEKQLACYRVG